MDKLPSFFLRRYDSHKIEKIMRRGAIHSYWDTKNKEAFKIDLAKTVVDTFFHLKFDISLDQLSESEWEPIVDFIIGQFNPLMDIYYRNFKKDYPMG
jgi:hypothetical protein